MAKYGGAGGQEERAERQAGVTEIGISGEQMLCCSHSTHMLCLQLKHLFDIYFNTGSKKNYF